EIDDDEFRRVTEVDYLGFVYGTRAALRRMLPRDRGTIVQVGSALAYRGIPLQTAYCGAKHAIKGFTEALRCELLHDKSGVRVTMVHLPALNTPQFDWVLSRLPRTPQPVPPIYQPEVAARAIVWASEHPRPEVWVGGSTVATILPYTGRKDPSAAPPPLRQGTVPARIDRPQRRALARHALPHQFVADNIPLVLFYATLWSSGVWVALFAALSWSYLAIVRRILTG